MIEIIGFSKEWVQLELGVSHATLHRYLLRLCHELGDSFPYEKGSKSIPSDCLEILKIYRQLIKEFNLKYATKNIKKELLKHGYIIQENQQQPTGKSTGKSNGFTIKFPR